MRRVAMVWLALVCVAAACSDDDSASPFDTVSSRWQAAYITAMNSYCACAVDPASDFCQKRPDDCFASVDLCEADTDPNVDDLACYSAALSLDEEGSLPLVECYAQAANALQVCLGAVQDCSAPEINACIESHESGSRVCPSLPDAVVSAYAKCK